ncbi:LysE family translocator [Vibrio fluvialis]|uniref:LysE family translocator n=1 Tax=Vibrio fluvialis TaxID=676 RepID=UPI001F54C643|nr:LysE family transporter [Vibrio fluvialis]
MTDIILYAFGVMYTPGPVNAIGLNNGIQKQQRIFGFFSGVAVAMFILFFSVAMIGERIMNESLLQGASVLGGLYIFWLAIKIFRSQVSQNNTGEDKNSEVRVLTFRDGLMMQLLNPKGITVALPVATVQFPAAGIAGGVCLPGVWGSQCLPLARLGLISFSDDYWATTFVRRVTSA